MDKASARTLVLPLRRNMDREEAECRSRIICRKFIESDEYRNASSILLYKAYNNEVGTDMIFESALRDRKTVAYPRSRIEDGEPVMRFYIVSGTDRFVSGYKGIPEPCSACDEMTGRADICIAPGVAFDSMCHRVGYGKAFYDRFLRENAPGLVIGLAYDIQIVDSIEPDADDVTPDMVITDTQIYASRG